MGSYFSLFYYETRKDPAPCPKEAEQKEDDTLLGNLNKTTQEKSGIHRDESLEDQSILYLDTNKSLILNDANSLVTHTQSLENCKSAKVAGTAVFKDSSGGHTSCNFNSCGPMSSNTTSTGTEHNPSLYSEPLPVCGEDIHVQIDLHSTKSKENLPPSPCAWEIDMGGFLMKRKRKLNKNNGKWKNDTKEKQKVNNDTNSVTSSYTDAVSVVTQATMALRKVFDQRRWYCMSRPQYSKSCGMSSLVSCWNYLFSTLGTGSLRPISQEEAMTVLGFKPPFGEIKFGPFTGNATLMRWFHQLCNHYAVRGRAYYLYKPKGKSRTVGITSDRALQKLKQALQDEQNAVIYHCHNHYFCPVGYEETPIRSLDAYRTDLPKDQTNTWVLVCDPSSRHPAINSIRWSDIDTDLNCENPHHMNIRKLHNGILQRKTKKVGGNLHCLMVFQRSSWQGVKRGVVMKHQQSDIEITNTDAESDKSIDESDD